MSTTQQSKILVTGGAGFIGSRLIDKLLSQGHEVVCVDNFMTGSKTNLLKHFDNPLLEIIRHDVTEPFQIECDEIYHLACPASPVHYSDNRIKTIKTAFLGTLHVLGIARRTKAKLLITSTSEVYGEAQVHPQSEDYYGYVNPCGLRSCYDEGKRAAEALAMDYYRTHNIDVKIARLFNTYGPNMCLQDGRLVSNFVCQALKGENITIYGTGSQTRSLCYVDDLVNGLIDFMSSESAGPGPINFGNPTELSVLAIAEKIKQLTNSSSKITFTNLPQNDPERRRPDITKAKKLVDWSPTTPLDVGLQMTIENFQKRLLPNKPEMRKWSAAAGKYSEQLQSSDSDDRRKHLQSSDSDDRAINRHENENQNGYTPKRTSNNDH